MSRIDLSPNSRSVLIASLAGEVYIWSASEPIVLRGHRGRVFGVAWSPDGRRLVSVSRDATVRIWLPFSSRPNHVELAKFEDELYRRSPEPS